MPVDYVVLLPDLETVQRRVAERTGHGFTDASATTRMHQQFAAAGAGLERHVLDSTSLTPAEVLGAVQAGVQTGRFALDRRP